MKKINIVQNAIICRVKKRRRQIFLRRRLKTKSSGIDDVNQTIDAPENFSISANPKECLDFIKKLRDAALKKAKFSRKGKNHNRGLYINLSAIKKLSVPAAVILSAELDRWRKHEGIKLQTKDLQRWDKEVVELLHDLGLFDLLDIDENELPLSDKSNGEVLKLTSNGRSDGYFVRKFLNEIKSSFKIELPSLKDAASPYDAVQEAFENSVSHAYPEGEQWAYQPVNLYWTTAYKEPESDTVRIFIYDQGIGIPESIRKSEKDDNKRLLDRLKSMLSSVSHADIIDGAFDIGKTSTGTQGRGYGMHTMFSLLPNERSYIRAISGEGDVKKQIGRKATKATLPANLHGTLIEWSISLS